LSVVFQIYANVHLHFKIPPTVFYPQPKVDSALVGLHFVSPHVLAQRLAGVSPIHLRTVVTTAFQQRRKTIRNSLKKLLTTSAKAKEAMEYWPSPSDVEDDNKAKGTTKAGAAALPPPPPLPESIRKLQQQGDSFAKTQQLCQEWASKRPEELTPGQFIELTRLIYGSTSPTNDDDDDDDEEPVKENGITTAADAIPSLPTKVWRKLKHGV
jgi:16S rRNA A1518/A1519 N6-dimethyltransferase RsmA/KsgA/DIM1 with predicted DNA glycosylase/AP lyase activity